MYADTKTATCILMEKALNSYPAMLTTFLSGLLLAIVSGLTFVAYKHPKGYRRIFWMIVPLFAILFVGNVLTYVIEIAVGIRQLGKNAVKVETELGKVSVWASFIESLNDNLTKLTWIVAVSFGISLFLLFLYALPSILKCYQASDDDKESQDKDKTSGTQPTKSMEGTD